MNLETILNLFVNSYSVALGRLPNELLFKSHTFISDKAKDNSPDIKIINTNDSVSRHLSESAALIQLAQFHQITIREKFAINYASVNNNSYSLLTAVASVHLILHQRNYQPNVQYIEKLKIVEIALVLLAFVNHLLFTKDNSGATVDCTGVASNIDCLLRIQKEASEFIKKELGFSVKFKKSDGNVFYDNGKCKFASEKARLSNFSKKWGRVEHHEITFEQSVSLLLSAMTYYAKELTNTYSLFLGITYESWDYADIIRPYKIFKAEITSSPFELEPQTPNHLSSRTVKKGIRLSNQPPPSIKLPEFLSDITPQALEKAIWSTPMKDIALAYDVNTTIITKLCEEKRIQRPNRKFWVHVEMGKTTATGQPIEIYIK
mgnify:CR=1 FL=1|tara:strand:- start:1954 stop:3081 length:1128 start_codon:yes stop_codon:yes gene_type:complete